MVAPAATLTLLTRWLKVTHMQSSCCSFQKTTAAPNPIPEVIVYSYLLASPAGDPFTIYAKNYTFLIYGYRKLIAYFVFKDIVKRTSGGMRSVSVG